MCLNWNELLSPFLMDADQNFENIFEEVMLIRRKFAFDAVQTHIMSFIRLDIVLNLMIHKLRDSNTKSTHLKT